MAKSHVVKLTVTNNSGHPMQLRDSWFDSGRVADGWSIPTTIAPNETRIVEMYERDWSTAGCSGLIDYAINGGTMTIAFSNPVSGHNKLGCGVGGKSVWDHMDYHDYKPFVESFGIGGIEFVATESCTGGDVNDAKVTLTTR